jgi:hypothetical protein
MYSRTLGCEVLAFNIKWRFVIVDVYGDALSTATNELGRVYNVNGGGEVG